jgi:hypothetical protein
MCGSVYILWRLIIKNDLFYHVKKDLDERNAIGKRIHGKDLFHTDSNNFLQEAYEEALDLSIYLKGEIFKRERYRQKKLELQRKYRNTPKGKLCFHRYNTSSKGKATVGRYQSTNKGREKNLRYSRSPKRLERAKWQMKSYLKRDKIKAML